MRKFLVQAALLLALSPFAPGDEELMKNALAQWEQQIREWRAAVSQAEGEREKEKARAGRPDGTEIADALWKAVGANSFREEWACSAVVWWLERPGLFEQTVPAEERKKAVGALWKSVEEVHYQNPLIAGACAALSRSADVRVYRVLEKIYAANPDDRAKGCAALALAFFLNKTNVFSEAEWGGDEMKKARRVFYVREALLKAADAPFGESTVGELAEEEIYRLRHLSEGSMAPAVTVIDGSGRAASLPLRGRASVLFFCTPDDEESVAVLKRSAVFQTQYPEFAFCPVVYAPNRDEAERRMALCGIACDFFLDADGEAARVYRVDRAPAVALVSANRRLLYFGAPDLNFQTRLDDCKREMTRQKEAAARESGEEEPPPVEKQAPPGLRPMPRFD